jgi:TPM domain
VETPLASAFALLIFVVTATLAQGETSSPKGTPTSQSSAREPSSQSSADAKTTLSVRFGGDVAQASLMYQNKGTNRGLLILLSVQDRQYRISVGLGLESVLPDEEADRLGREMVPMLKKGDYGKALLQLAKSIQLEIAPKVE